MVNAVPQLEIGQALQLAWSRLTDMNGRSRRSEFWWVMLVAFIANIVFSFIPKVGYLFSLALFIGLIPLEIRRLHDTGKSAGLLWAYVAIGGLALVLATIGGLTVSEADYIAAYVGHATTPMVILGIAGFLFIPAGIIAIILIVFWCQDSQPFPNQYGVSPKYPDGQLYNGGYQQPQYGPQQPQQPQYGPRQ